jgi:hypothetical protein
METTEAKIPNYVFEDLLFHRRLQRNINDELGRLNRLLEEQVELLQKRKELMVEVDAAVMLHWRSESNTLPESENSNTEDASQ